jgi:hypothetical protein
MTDYHNLTSRKVLKQHGVPQNIVSWNTGIWFTRIPVRVVPALYVDNVWLI